MTTASSLSTAAYQTPAFYADAQAALGQSMRGIAGGAGAASALPRLETRTSLTTDVQSLKAQQAALDLLHGVTSAAKTVLGQAADLLSQPETATGGETVHPVDVLVKSATFDGQPLFDPRVNHQTVRDLLSAPEGSATLSIFSAPVKDALQAAFENAFDIYA